MRRHAACVTALVTLIPFTVALPSPAQDQAAADLVRFDDCGAFLDHVKTEAPARVGPYGFGAGRSYLAWDVAEAAAAEAEATADSVASVMAGCDTVNASAERLYVANRPWIDRNDFGVADEDRTVTHIHRFDVSGPNGPVYEASGAVNGLPLNRFAMSEHDGNLRVASTNLPMWGWWRADGTSESRVDVLERDGARPRVVGSVEGLDRERADLRGSVHR